MAILRIIETERPNLKSVKDVEHLNYSIDQHMKRIKDRSDSKKIVKFFQMLSEYSVKYSGVSFRRNKLWAKELGVSVRTIQRYTQFLVELNAIIKIPTDRKHNRGQATNTICILPVIKSVVSRVCHGVCHAFNPSVKPTSLKHEKHNYIASKEISTEFIPSDIRNDINFQTINGYMSLKLYEKVKRGYSIESLGSLCGKFMNNEIDKMLYRVQKQLQRQEQQRKQKQHEQQWKDKELPFYNWLTE